MHVNNQWYVNICRTILGLKENYLYLGFKIENLECKFMKNIASEGIQIATFSFIKNCP